MLVHYHDLHCNSLSSPFQSYGDSSMKRIFTFAFLFISLALSAQQPLRVMHYNLLNFGVFSSYCTVENNNPSDKIPWLETVVDQYVPDILVVNEMSPSAYYQDMVLDEVMNTSGRETYARAEATNVAGSEIVNMLYYNTDIVGLAAQDVIGFWLRDINVYKLYTKPSGQVVGVDTNFIWFFTAHFKAGSTTNDKNTRAQMAGAIMDYIQSHDISEPCLLTGDLNLQNDLEPAWVQLTSVVHNNGFTDPAGMVGIWHNNESFGAVHSQSTHTDYDGCKASGGMDDRFDFILVNDTLMNDQSPVHFVDNSYQVPGQDGQRLNGSLVDPPNYSAPPEVIDAMYHFSDHLPVMITLYVEEQTGLPASWDFTVTDNIHTITLPATVEPTLNSAPLQPGLYIGAFFTDSGQEHCAGYTLWSGTTGAVIRVYGDEASLYAKNGFKPGEPMIFKVFDFQQQNDFYADADFNPDWPDHSGRYTPDGQSELTGLDAAYLQLHPVEMDAGWSTLSSFLVPKWMTIESVFGENLPGVIYMTDGTNLFYPSGGTEDLQYWTGPATFLIKTSTNLNLTIEGLPVDDLTIGLHPGWNLLPVPVPCYVYPEELTTNPAGCIIAVKSVAAAPVYWPDKGISSLERLIPGNAYLINVTESCSLQFSTCK